MTGFIVHVGANIICTHGGQVFPITLNKRVLVSGQPVVTSSDTYPVVACSLAISGSTPPCTNIQWLVPSSHITIDNKPIILQDSVGICQNAAQVTQGVPIISATQIKATGL